MVALHARTGLGGGGSTVAEVERSYFRKRERRPWRKVSGVGWAATLHFGLARSSSAKSGLT